jgi:hypothetical protein
MVQLLIVAIRVGTWPFAALTGWLDWPFWTAVVCGPVYAFSGFMHYARGAVHAAKYLEDQGYGQKSIDRLHGQMARDLPVGLIFREAVIVTAIAMTLHVAAFWLRQSF